MKGRYQAQFARRPGYNTSGDNIKVNVNQFRVTSLGNPDVWQFDVGFNIIISDQDQELTS